MTVASDSQAHFHVTDENGTRHYVECLKCAFKLLRTTCNGINSQITITTNCDWNGPSSTITITLKNGVNSTTVNPPSALFIDGGCTKNRIVYDQAAADNLLANNGYSPYLTAIQNTTIPSNATVMTIAKAATMYSFVSSPDPTPTPNPAASSTPTTTPTTKVTPKPTVNPTNTPTNTPVNTPTPARDCEACSMEVNADAQAKYLVIDGSKTGHYVECFMCALSLLNDYDNLTITTYCDWYGPDYPITVQSQQYGKVIDVAPDTAVFLNGGSCVTNRVGYNQTAANQLLINGFSKYTLPEQDYDLPKETTQTLVSSYAVTFSAKNNTNPALAGPVIIAVIVGAVLIVASVVAYKKIKH